MGILSVQGAMRLFKVEGICMVQDQSIAKKILSFLYLSFKKSKQSS